MLLKLQLCRVCKESAGYPQIPTLIEDHVIQGLHHYLHCHRENSAQLRLAALHPLSRRTLDPKFTTPRLLLLVLPMPSLIQMSRRVEILLTGTLFLGGRVLPNLCLVCTLILDYLKANMVCDKYNSICETPTQTN